MKLASQSSKDRFVVDVQWISPRNPLHSDMGKMLSLDEQAYNEASKTAEPIEIKGLDQFSPENRERYTFPNREQAETFKQSIDRFYSENPQYFVVDDEGKKVLDEDGKPIVAWEPSLTVEPADDPDGATPIVIPPNRTNRLEHGESRDEDGVLWKKI